MTVTRHSRMAANTLSTFHERRNAHCKQFGLFRAHYKGVEWTFRRIRYGRLAWVTERNEGPPFVPPFAL